MRDEKYLFSIKQIFTMFNIILFQPEIPPNTGNIIRLCANTGATLHLIKPLGFVLNDKQLIRAGLDYHELASIQIHNNWLDCYQHLQSDRIFTVTTKGKQRYSNVQYQVGDTFLFGSETAGLPSEILASFPDQQRIRIPMIADSRSINLSNAAAIIIYEAWRQKEFSEGI